MFLASFFTAGNKPGRYINAIGGALVIYIISVAIALSPVGEWILRFQLGCGEIKRAEHKALLEPLFKEVYQKAKEKDPTISDDVKLYINRDKAPNAFATGRKTICVTEGLLDMQPENIKGVLGHEFGHLAHKDTDLILLVTVGNMIVTGFITFFRVVLNLLFATGHVVGSASGRSTTEGLWLEVMFNVVVAAFMWLWSKIGVVLVMKTSRDNEYEADRFSYELGYGNGVCAFLDSIGDNSQAKGLFAVLSSSHPDSNDRISRLQALGATYRNVSVGR